MLETNRQKEIRSKGFDMGETIQTTEKLKLV